MNNGALSRGAGIVFMGGSILFCVGYFLPDNVALQGATLAASVFGYVIYLRINNWKTKDEKHKVVLLFAVTLLVSLWASLCLVAACSIFPKLPLCIENRRNSFVILYFFFPILIVFFSWLSTRWLRSK